MAATAVGVDCELDDAHALLVGLALAKTSQSGSTTSTPGCSAARLRRLLQQHEADELRHAHLLAVRREQLGLPEHAIPAHLDLVERLSTEAGGLLRREMRCDEDVADAFTLLYVIEERALDEFGRAAAALRETGDDGTAQLFDEIAADERRVYGRQTRDWTWHLLSTGLLTLPMVLGAVVCASLSLANRLALPAPEPVLVTG